MDLKLVNDTIYKYVRPLTHPLAVRMCSSLDEIPKEAQFPKRDFGVFMPVCQVFTLAHRLALTMAIGLEDQQCPLGNLALGFLKPKKAFLDGSFHWSLLPSREANIRYAEAIARLEYGKYSHLLVAPIEKAAFEPHFFLIYGNPAQVARLVQGTLFLRGGLLSSPANLGATCGSIVSHTMLTDECQFILIGSGPRRAAQVQDHEMAFTIPASKVEQVIKGLEESEKMAYTYPLPIFLKYQREIPDSYEKLQDYLMKEGE